MRQQENYSGEKNLDVPIILRSKPSSCLGVGYTGHTYIKERLHLKLKLEVEVDAHVKKSWNPTRTMRLVIFPQPSAFIRGHLHAQLEQGMWRRAIAILAILNRGFRADGHPGESRERRGRSAQRSKP